MTIIRIGRVLGLVPGLEHEAGLGLVRATRPRSRQAPMIIEANRAPIMVVEVLARHLIQRKAANIRREALLKHLLNDGDSTRTCQMKKTISSIPCTVADTRKIGINLVVDSIMGE